MIENWKRRLRWAWSHRTKIAGGVGIGAGVLQNQLQGHPEVHLPAEGVLLIWLGAAVVAIGTYNSVAQFFGWTDPPP